MKKKIIPLLFIIPLVSLSSCGQENRDVNKGKTPVDFTAQEMFDSIKVGYNIGNTLDAHPGVNNFDHVPDGVGTETSWGQPKITKEYIHFVKECGFDSIRLPVTWYPHVDNEWKIEQVWLERVKEVVDYCVDEDLPVILNVHHDTGVDGWLKATEDDARQDEELKNLTTLWEQLADYFKDYDVHDLMFEGFNEMIDDEGDWTSPSDKSIDFINEANQKFVDVVRASGGNNDERILLCVTYAGTSYGNMLTRFKIPNDTVAGAIAFEVHAYTPWEFCDGQTNTYDLNSITGMMDTISNMFKDTSIPVIIGEFGTVFRGNNFKEYDYNVRVQYANDYAKSASERDIHIYLWDDNGNFRLIDRNNLKVVHQDYLDALLQK